MGQTSLVIDVSEYFVYLFFILLLVYEQFIIKLVKHNHYYTYVPAIAAVTGSLGGPAPNLLNAVTMTGTVPLNTPSGSDGAVNVSVVVELLTFIIVPL